MHDLSDPGLIINPGFLADETQLVRALAERARLGAAPRAAVDRRALALVDAVRRGRGGGSIDAFMQEYSLASREGVILMCLAEALLRIPDDATADRLIADKIPDGAWSDHLGDSDSLFVNASTWGLMLTGRLVALDRDELRSTRSWYERLAGRIGEPVARAALRQAMKILGHQFVMGRNTAEALTRAAGGSERLYRYSFDMLGESALTAGDAQRYLEKYLAAIAAVGRSAPPAQSVIERHSISVKLSALHPRYEFAQERRVRSQLGPTLIALVRAARAAGVGLTVDAEEADRLGLSLQLIDQVLADEVTRGYDGFGLALQAYQKRADGVVSWLGDRSRMLGRRITVRLVKGAYWDSEIKRAQERGLAGYPVFTRKCNTDVSYLACARRLASLRDVIYPQFATHNAHTVAYIAELFGADGRFEFQRLHGMGEELYSQIVAGDWGRHPVRVYAPVGEHEDLLPYLVRRLLENGANTSFVNRIVDASLPPAAVTADPVAEVDGLKSVPHSQIPLPVALFGKERNNSAGLNFADPLECAPLLAAMRQGQAIDSSQVRPAVSSVPAVSSLRVMNPARESECVGVIRVAHVDEIDAALATAWEAQPEWDARGGKPRAALLRSAADLFEARRFEIVRLLVREAGKTLPDSLSELREAVDFLRYYAARAERDFGDETLLPGPTGELNLLRLRGRGVFAAISPWNFPLAIYVGQIAAALAAGNAVIGKPAEQTPLTGMLATGLLHEAGIPREVLACLPGDGASVGAAIVRDARVAGVVFTGSIETARRIERILAAREGAIPTLIAETGGLNAMIVDSSALAEQVVQDVIQSGFNSAGQRCSALRVLLLQEEIADRVQGLLAGCMDELVVGDPAELATDIGPVIDQEALQMLHSHAATVLNGARWSHRAPLGADCGKGRYFAPLAVELTDFAAVNREVFGPVVHIVRYRAKDIDAVIDAINAKGFGLTLGIHTRIDGMAQRIARRARIGNVYINRNMIGAVVGVQPFGGSGLSGTGPKAGGPHYLHRFATEQTITTNTSAVGGNAGLMSLAAD